MKLFILLVAVFFLFSNKGYAQKYYTKNGSISFFSTTNMEDIKADNNQVVSVLNVPTGELLFSLLIKSFHFPKALMEEHFNEDYLESDKYPKANFTGSFTGDFVPDKDGTYNVIAKGNLTLHNVTKPIEEPATLEVKAGRLLGKTVFKLRPEDFNISIPSIVRDKITKEITVLVNIDCNTTK